MHKITASQHFNLNLMNSHFVHFFEDGTKIKTHWYLATFTGATNQHLDRRSIYFSDKSWVAHFRQLQFM